MEQALTKLAETWSKVDFQFVQFKDSSLYTVRMADEDFESLEDNQVCKHKYDCWCGSVCVCVYIFWSACVRGLFLGASCKL